MWTTLGRRRARLQPVIQPSRGGLYWVDWDPGRGSEQTGRRPALVVQNNLANSNDRYPNTVVIALSTRGRFRSDGSLIGTQVQLDSTPETGLKTTSFALCDQVMTIAKSRLESQIGKVEPEVMEQVESAIRAHLDL